CWNLTGDSGVRKVARKGPRRQVTVIKLRSDALGGGVVLPVGLVTAPEPAEPGEGVPLANGQCRTTGHDEPDLAARNVLVVLRSEHQVARLLVRTVVQQPVRRPRQGSGDLPATTVESSNPQSAQDA